MAFLGVYFMVVGFTSDDMHGMQSSVSCRTRDIEAKEPPGELTKLKFRSSSSVVHSSLYHEKENISHNASIPIRRPFSSALYHTGVTGAPPPETRVGCPILHGLWTMPFCSSYEMLSIHSRDHSIDEETHPCCVFSRSDSIKSRPRAR
jgi:hypothetical protein